MLVMIMNDELYVRNVRPQLVYEKTRVENNQFDSKERSKRHCH